METAFNTTPSDTEAATILTTIKGGEMIANQQQCFELLNDFETSTASGVQTNYIQKMDVDAVVESTATDGQLKNEDGQPMQFLASDDDMFKHFTSGPLDALASAALQASTKQTITTTPPLKVVTPSPKTDKKTIKPKEEVGLRFLGGVFRVLNFFSSSAKRKRNLANGRNFQDLDSHSIELYRLRRVERHNVSHTQCRQPTRFDQEAKIKFRTG